MGKQRRHTPGHAFSIQLVPDLADDVWLHVEVWRELEFTVNGRTYAECLEVFYLADLGVQVNTGTGGEETERSRAFSAGTIVYAPTVGPIFNRERQYLGGLEPLPLIVESTAELVGAGISTP